MTIPRWLILLRLSPYLYFGLFGALLISHHWLKLDINLSAAFYFGIALLVASRILWYVLILREARNRRLRGETSTGRLGELPGYDRPANETNVREALRRLAETGAGCAPELDAAVEDWLASAPGQDKDRKRDDLLQRLYAQAGSQLNPLDQNQALNRLRLAINPWVQD